MSEGVHSRKGGYVCPGPSEEFGWTGLRVREEGLQAI